MAKFRATINYNNGDHELRFYYSDALTKQDIEYMIEHDIRAEFIQSFSVNYDETDIHTELAEEISAIVDDYKAKFADRLSKAFKFR